MCSVGGNVVWGVMCSVGGHVQCGGSCMVMCCIKGTHGWVIEVRSQPGGPILRESGRCVSERHVAHEITLTRQQTDTETSMFSAHKNNDSISPAPPTFSGHSPLASLT